MSDYLLTTVDNPYNPHTQFEAWYRYDVAHGHNSLALLARIAVVSDELSEADRDAAIKLAIDEIVRENVSGVHKKIAAPS